MNYLMLRDGRAYLHDSHTGKYNCINNNAAPRDVSKQYLSERKFIPVITHGNLVILRNGHVFAICPNNTTKYRCITNNDQTSNSRWSIVHMEGIEGARVIKDEDTEPHYNLY